MEALAKILASAPRAVSKYRANVPDHLSGHCKMAAGSGLGTRLSLKGLKMGVSLTASWNSMGYNSYNLYTFQLAKMAT